MLKKTMLALMAVLAVGVWTLAASAWAQNVPPTVRLGYFNGPRPWILAKADGSFDKAFGTKVEWVAFPSGAAALSSLAAKEVDISRLGSSPTVAAIVRKLPIEMIAISGVIATSERLIVKRSIPNLKALEGKTVSFPPGSTAHYALLAAFNAHKVDQSKVRLLEMRPGDMLAAWQRGDIDGAYVWGPFSHQMETQNGHAILATKDLQQYGYFVWNDYVVRKEFAERYPDIVVKFLQVFADTVDRYKRDPAGSAAIIAKTLDQSVDFAKDTLAGLEYPPIAEQLEARWLGAGADTAKSNIARAMGDTANFLAQLGDVRRADIPASFGPSLNTTYIAKAVGKN